MSSGCCNHKELESKESQIQQVYAEGRNTRVMFMVKKYCLISKSSKKLVAWGKGGVPIIERRCNANFQQAPDSSKPGILTSRKEVAVCK